MVNNLWRLLMSLLVATTVLANDGSQHPCTGEGLPLTTEKAVVAAIECLYNGRVAKVTKVDGSGSRWFYELRILSSNGRVKTVDVDPLTGLPLDPAELRELNL